MSRESFVNLSDEVFERVGVDPEFSEHLDKPSLTYWADVWRRFKQNKLAIFGLVLMVAILVMIFVGPLISGKNYKYMDSSVKNLSPNSEYWFGTDDMGRDIFTRVCYGGRISILIGFLCTIVMFVIGSTLGALSGLKGGWV
ncbi:MAG: ABC transporter permease, partial [Bacillota bacterium]